MHRSAARSATTFHDVSGEVRWPILGLCEAEGMTFIHPFDDPLVIAGQGTIGLELLEQVENLEAVVVPIGGGGLIGGVAGNLSSFVPHRFR